MIQILSNSDVIFLLMSVGLYGLIYECVLPGGLLPGITGAICLLLWMFAQNGMPVNYFGVLLMIVGIGCMTVEAFLNARYAFALIGAISFAAGSKIFINVSPATHGVSPWLIGSMTLISLGVLSVGLKYVLRTRKRSVSTGAEALRNATGEIVNWDGMKGEVQAAGSVWKARSTANHVLKKGDKVKVHEIDGLCLIVEPVHSS
jgi:membrane-bound serine protease (ClpP class)